MRGFGLNHGDAEDVLHTSFENAMTAKNKPSSDQFVSWFYRIASNNAINHIRKHKSGRVILLETPVSELSDGEVSYDVFLDEKVLARRLYETTWDKKGEQDATVLLLRSLGYSVKDTAFAVGVKPGTVKSKLSRLQDYLKRTIDEELAKLE